MVATIGALVGAVAALVYGGYAASARRGVFSDLASDASSVSRDAAASSDTTNGILLVVALVIVVVAVGLWVTVVLAAGKGRNTLGYAGFGALGVGIIAALVGGFLSTGAESIEDAGKVATAYVLVGLGFIVMAIGLLLAAIALRQSGTDDDARPSASPDPRGSAYGTPAYGGGQPYGPPQYGGGQGDPFAGRGGAPPGGDPTSGTPGGGSPHG